MDLTDLALMVGRVDEGLRENTRLLTQHLATQEALDDRLKNVESFVGKARTISTIIGTVGAGLWSFVTFNWIKK